MSRVIVTMVAAFVAVPLLALGQELVIPEIEYREHVLDNGLRVILHEDHKAPIVAVNVWYHVGSKNERPGRTGFAHLFEHLMFNGSENFNDDYFQAMERVGATELNGTTWYDRTNYFQNVSANALDVALWMESDRMGHLLGVISQERLDEQRDVVKNEKRQMLNQPYMKAMDMLPALAYPAGHPYSWSTIGSMEDLDVASLEDVTEWFQRYYGAANATLVLAGAIDTEAALEKVKLYFGDIASGPPLDRPSTWIARRTGSTRAVVDDRVPQARVYKSWNVPPWGTEANDHLELVAELLAGGKTSRLYRRLVYEEQIATDVSATMFPFEIGGMLLLSATARPGQPLDAVERALGEELRRLIEEGPGAEELQRVKVQHFAAFARSIEGVGGFGGKSDLLARHAVYRGDPGSYAETLRRVRDVTAAELRDAAAEWLSDGELVVEVHPWAERKVAESGADRSRLPDAGQPPLPEFPELQRARLSNGLELIAVARPGAPIVEMSLVLDAGYAADRGGEPGTASLALGMLDEGAGSMSALEISEELARLGATLSAGSNLDSSVVSLSALSSQLEPSLDLFADVALRPSFPAKELERLKQEQLAQIQREKATPVQMGLRVLPRLLYGEDHPYGLPLTGSGDEESVARIERADLVAFHETWFRPGSATLIAVGDATLDALRPLIEARFGDWRGGSAPEKGLEEVPPPQREALYLIDRPGSQQSVILGGDLAPPRSAPDDLAIQTFNTILGGAFTARLNMKLREEKGWSYGAGSFIPGARGQRPFLVFAPVQTDKTGASLSELNAMLRAILDTQPVTDDEVAKAKDQQTLTLPGQWETNGDVLGSISEMVRFGLPDGYWDAYPERVRSLSRRDVSVAAPRVVRPDGIVWVVVGDRSRVEADLAALGLGEVRLLDPDGRPVGN